MKRPVVWYVSLCSPLQVRRRFGGIYCLHNAVLAAWFLLTSFFVHSLTLKIAARCSSDRSANFYRNIALYSQSYYSSFLPFSEIFCNIINYLVLWDSKKKSEAIVLKAITLKNTTPCGLVLYRRFREKHCLHLQGGRVSQAMIRCASTLLLGSSACYATKLHRVTFQIIILFSA